MQVFLLGLDGATWDLLRPLAAAGDLPNLARLMAGGAYGSLESVFPPLSPVAWTGVMTGKNSGKHGVFEFLEHSHNPLLGRVNSSRAIKAELVWEIAGRHGKSTVAGGVPMSFPHRNAPGTYIGDFLAPPDAPGFASSPEILKELELELGRPYQPWSTAVHDGGREGEALTELTEFLDDHLKAVSYLARRGGWDLFMYDLMATDRIQHELWHAWEPAHLAGKGRDLSKVREGFIEFWRKLDRGVGEIVDALPSDTAVFLISDHGFGPIEWHVNFNVWLLQHGDITLQNSFYVKQKKWCYDRGVTPAWFYGLMVKLGMGRQRVARFRGKQTGWVERLAESAFLSRRHIDWSKTKAYAQGNFGQIFVNQKGRQPQGCVAPEDVRPYLNDLKAALREIAHPVTNEPLIATIHERDELYHGPYTHLAPDLTVVLKDWRYRTIGLHDFTTHKVISPAIGPTGDHRTEGVLIAHGPAFVTGSKPRSATLLDLAPTILHLLGVPVPSDMDGRVLTEIIDSAVVSSPVLHEDSPMNGTAEPVGVGYSSEDEAEVQKRLGDLGYL